MYPIPVPPIRFGLFEIDPITGEVRKRGLQVRLQPQAAQVLLLLLEEPGRMCTREELKRRLWPAGTYVDFDHSLNKCMHSIRAALGDPAYNPRFIETIPGQGYRFIGIAPSGETKPHGTRGSSMACWKELPIAVLPFYTTPTEPELTFLSSQIACLVIDGLSRVSGLKVLAYSRIRLAMARTAEPDRLGSALGVGGLVSGELTRRDHGLYIHAEMVDISDGTQVWGAQIEPLFPNGIDCPDNVAQQILEHVLLSLRTDRAPQALRATG